jgi:hypothetical protein
MLFSSTSIDVLNRLRCVGTDKLVFSIKKYVRLYVRLYLIIIILKFIAPIQY